MPDPLPSSHSAPDRDASWPGLFGLASAAFLTAWIVVQLFFVPTAFRVDEPNIIAIARAIAGNAIDPYGFVINWIGEPQPAFEVLSNPPGLPYWIAGWASLFGWSESSLHIACIPFSVLALFSFAVISSDRGLPGITAMTLMAGSPAFVVGSQVVMPDVPMLSFFVAAVALALRFQSTGSRLAMIGAFSFAALTPILKYNGILLVPVLGTIALVWPRRRVLLLIVSTAPVLGLAAWSGLSWLKYGDAHLVASARFQSAGGVDVLTALLPILGIGILPIASIVAVRPEHLKPWQEMLFLGVAFLVWLASGLWVLWYPFLVALGFAAACTLGLRFLLFAGVRVASSIRTRRLWMLVLGVWILATIMFQYRLLFTATRYVIPLLPAALLMLFPSATSSRRFQAAAWTSVVLAFAVAVGDARTANVSREFVKTELASLARGGRLFFDGHWGFQHYTAEIGGRLLSKSEDVSWLPGDVVAIALNAFPSRKGPERAGRTAQLHSGSVRWREQRRNISIGWPLHTMDCTKATSFYSNGVANCGWALTAYLPWSLSSAASERFGIWVAEPRSE